MNRSLYVWGLGLLGMALLLVAGLVGTGPASTAVLAQEPAPTSTRPPVPPLHTPTPLLMTPTAGAPAPAAPVLTPTPTPVVLLEVAGEDRNFTWGGVLLAGWIMLLAGVVLRIGVAAKRPPSS